VDIKIYMDMIPLHGRPLVPKCCPAASSA